MFSFFKKKKGSQISVPDWATFMTPKEYSIFIKATEEYFNKLNIGYSIENEGVVLVSENDFGFGQLGLHNIAQICKQNDIKDYKAIVKDHFDAMVRIHKFNKEFEETVSNFEKIEKYIAVRLYNMEYGANLEGDNIIVRDFAEGIIAMLVFDLPESVVNIKPEQVTPWNKTIDELFELGNENIRKNYPIDLSEHKVGEHMIWFAEADHFFASNFAFDIKNYPQVVGSQGSLVSIPNRHTVIIYPIRNLDVIGVLNNMLYLTSRMHEDGPGSITDRLYWYNDGKFTNLPHKMENEKLVFSPPGEFVDVLNELGKEN
ncbi:MAG: hypothetical protein E6767_08695 [Dysgonomonas sp.]|nr:hypothetical protein [Dysgonomonas sp.]